MNRLTASDIRKSPFLNHARISEDLGNLVVLSPHPDDESLGCGGLIAMLRKSGNEVTVIFITSGSASHPNSKTHPPDVLAKIREKEAISACSKLGVPHQNVHFLRASDSKLNLLDNIELQDTIKMIISILRDREFSSIAVPWRRDPHPDHRITYKLGNLLIDALNKAMIKLEYPIWLWENGKKEDWPIFNEIATFRLDITDYVDQKLTALNQHQSQLGKIIKDDPHGFVLSDNVLKVFREIFEYFLIENTHYLTTLDETYFKKLYADNNDPWNFRNSSYEHEKYDKSLKALNKSNFKKGLEIGCSIGMQTKLLAGICEKLVAVDISDVAIREAKMFCANHSNITFALQDIATDFPHGQFDLITLCEVGYYLDKDTLLKTCMNIDRALVSQGRLLLVHWTGFVPDYPLTGDEVHSLFEAYMKSHDYKDLTNERTEFYRLQIWEKPESVLSD